MKDIIKMFDEDLVYLKHQVYNDRIKIFVCSSRESALCPYCGHSSSKRHSTYHRTFQDLSMQDKKVEIDLLTQKYFCLHPECPYKTFAERFDFIEPKAQKTKRVIDFVITIAIEVSSVTASKILSGRVVTICKSSICNLLKNIRPNKIDKRLVKRICIDDFAFKKGHNYGTVMIDIDTGRIIDLLPSRKTADVVKWLKKYPNIELVSRDGSSSYAAAIKEAHPNAIQVSDRFHILKNLTDYGQDVIKRLIPSSFQIQTETEVDSQVMGSDFWEKEENHEINPSETQHLTSIEKKRARVEQVRSLAADGLSISDIEKEVGLSHATIKKYLDAKFVLENKLESYTEKIDAMLQDRCKLKEIEAAIRDDGYRGPKSTIQVYTTQQRRIMKELKAEEMKNTETIKRKGLIGLLYVPIEKVKGITFEQVQRVIQEYPVIGELYELMRSFKKMMFTKQVNDLASWIERALQLQIEEIDSFIGGITRDLEAVENAIALEYSNGLAEGSVNKLKVTKRIMYGRSSFILLRNKILLKEFGWRFN